MNHAPSLDVANSARTVAIHERARQLIAVTEETKTIHEVIRNAATPHGRPLLRITLRQLLLAQPGWGEQKTTGALNKMARVIGQPAPTLRKLTIAWLLDPRAGGRRFMAFCDIFSAKSASPWPGFPFAPKATTQNASGRGTK
jgi:hypothetical protein